MVLEPIPEIDTAGTHKSGSLLQVAFSFARLVVYGERTEDTMPFAAVSQPGLDIGLLDMVARLVLAGVLGALVGYERETHGRPAGLRTHMLVCMGSTVFTIVSVSFTGQSQDPARIASQIVSGIGFLGAGTIIRQGSAVRGLTTAASLWTIAAIGMAVGVNWELATFAVVSAVVVFVVLGVITRVEHSLISHRRYRELTVIMKEVEQAPAAIYEAITRHGVEIQGVRMEDTGEPNLRMLKIRLRVPTGVSLDLLNEALTGVQSLTSFDWD
ncbi:MAG: MgtC/SapB family protein [Armatimonadota bacterium]|nr:MgtC/SapB family protein [Armatimonadota bacterium]